MIENYILQINNLSYAYNKNDFVLDGFSLTVKNNSITAILGKNGCGKSTLLNCISGQNKIDDGSIIILGKNLNDISVSNRAKMISYMYQSTDFRFDGTVLDYALLGRNPYLRWYERPGPKDVEYAETILKQCGIYKIKDRLLDSISGGERQLAALAQTLVQDTKIILLDEPISNLDFGNQFHFLEILCMLSKKGKSVIFTTHNPNILLDIECNVAVVDKGKLLSYGMPKDVLNKETLKKVYNHSFIIYDNYIGYDWSKGTVYEE